MREPLSIDFYAGEQVKAIREALGISQDELAKFCGITFQQIQKYENGKNRMSLGRLGQIAIFLKTPIIHFFPQENRNTVGSMDQICAENADMRERLDKINALSARKGYF